MAKTVLIILLFCSCNARTVPTGPKTVTTRLDGSKSIADYFFWRQISGQSVVINGVTNMSPSVTFTNKGVYEFELMVSMKNVLYHPLDTVKITVK